MPTPTTTWSAIRANTVAVIESITPVSITSQPFRRTVSNSASFRDYAEDNDGAVFREFEVSLVGAIEPVGVRDRQVVLRRADVEIVIAYPHHWGNYTTKDADDRNNQSSLIAIADEDLTRIAKSCGVAGYSNNLAGQFGAQDEVIDFEDGDGVTFAVLSFATQWYEDATTN